MFKLLDYYLTIHVTALIKKPFTFLQKFNKCAVIKISFKWIYSSNKRRNG